MKDRGRGIVQTERNVQRFKKILVAFDGSEYSIRDLRAAQILAKGQGSELLVLYMILPLIYSHAGMSNVDIQRIGRIEKEETKAIVKSGNELIREGNIDAKIKVVGGSSLPFRQSRNTLIRRVSTSLPWEPWNEGIQEITLRQCLERGCGSCTVFSPRGEMRKCST